jgi:hypothetical protein
MTARQAQRLAELPYASTDDLSLMTPDDVSAPPPRHPGMCDETITNL